MSQILPYLLFTHVYYLLLAIVTQPLIRTLLVGKISSPVRSIEILAWVPSNQFSMFAFGMGCFTVMIFGLTALYPYSRILRFFTFLGLVVLVGIFSSYGKVIHGFYGWILTSFSMIFLPRLSRRDKAHFELPAKVRLEDWILFVQFSAVICYALAGFWKLRYIPMVIRSYGFNEFLRSPGNTIAYEHLKFGFTLSPLSQLFLEHDALTLALFIGLVVLQCMSILIALVQRYHLLLGVLLILFHVMSELIVHIPFRPQLYLIALLFIAWPLLRDQYGSDQTLLPRQKSTSRSWKLK